LATDDCLPDWGKEALLAMLRPLPPAAAAAASTCVDSDNARPARADCSSASEPRSLSRIDDTSLRALATDWAEEEEDGLSCGAGADFGPNEVEAAAAALAAELATDASSSGLPAALEECLRARAAAGAEAPSAELM